MPQYFNVVICSVAYHMKDIVSLCVSTHHSVTCRIEKKSGEANSSKAYKIIVFQRLDSVSVFRWNILNWASPYLRT
jgi:hypothetical protein